MQKPYPIDLPRGARGVRLPNGFWCSASNSGDGRPIAERRATTDQRGRKMPDTWMTARGSRYSGASNRRATPVPCGNPPSMAACNYRDSLMTLVFQPCKNAVDIYQPSRNYLLAGRHVATATVR